MSREAHKVTKRIAPTNEPGENHKLAQFGDLWGTEEFVWAFYWRYSLTLCSFLEGEVRKQREASIQMEIGSAFGRAIREGNWRLLDALTKATKFVDEHFDWNVKTLSELTILWRLEAPRFKPVDLLRVVIAREYYFITGEPNDTVKKTRKDFVKHVESMLPEAVEERTFSRAFKELGIRWKR